jgi:hypothetical protein
MCLQNCGNTPLFVQTLEEYKMELRRLRWEAELREQELDRLYQVEDRLKRFIYFLSSQQ